MQVGSRVQTTGCVRGLLSGPVVYTDQRLFNRVGCCRDCMLVYEARVSLLSHLTQSSHTSGLIQLMSIK